MSTPSPVSETPGTNVVVSASRRRNAPRRSEARTKQGAGRCPKRGPSRCLQAGTAHGWFQVLGWSRSCSERVRWRHGGRVAHKSCAKGSAPGDDRTIQPAQPSERHGEGWGVGCSSRRENADCAYATDRPRGRRRTPPTPAPDRTGCPDRPHPGPRRRQDRVDLRMRGPLNHLAHRFELAWIENHPAAVGTLFDLDVLPVPAQRQPVEGGHARGAELRGLRFTHEHRARERRAHVSRGVSLEDSRPTRGTRPCAGPALPIGSGPTSPTDTDRVHRPTTARAVQGQSPSTYAKTSGATIVASD